MPTPESRPRALPLAILLVITGAIGFIAAWALTLDKFTLLADPDTRLGCDVNVLIGCGKNLSSDAGNLFGFPNPLLGLGGWTATIAVGVSLLAGARFARWYWLIFNLGVAGALALVIYLITASVTFIGDLCPWCMVTWVVTIPTFWAVTFFNLSAGHLPLPRRLRRAARRIYGWVPLITLVSYLIVAVIAQIRLDWLHNAFV